MSAYENKRILGKINLTASLHTPSILLWNTEPHLSIKTKTNITLVVIYQSNWIEKTKTSLSFLFL